MDLLPPQLRSFDGHPHAKLAAKVMADLAKVGLPAHVVDDADDHSRVNGGVVLYISEPPGKELLVSWYVPDEQRYRARDAQDRPEAMGAVATLTAAMVSVLTAFNYRVRTEYNDRDFPYPFVYLQPDSGS
ncbi:hypothetical protein OG301_04165 [Streptomyces platensis]|uniref:hypothetical protein n=1 Tax=Streptomyces platensis TaxID=58346 RepID=UPI002E7FDF12|nr:hypothetical protein [Streptomyces platensis]WTI50646.1 hypothetical protein OG301_04165 [Streptomyces platensis]WUB83798.1 hypothetical protein OG424_34135 [Streptomyces platensis]